MVFFVREYQIGTKRNALTLFPAMLSVFCRCFYKLTCFIKFTIVWQIAFWHKPKNFTAINNRCHIIKFSVMVKRKSDYTDDFVRFRLLAVCSQSIFCAFY